MGSIKYCHVNDLRRARGDVKRTYRKLSRVLDLVSRLADQADETRIKACFAILEDDLELLMEECENTLVGGEVNPENAFSLICRSHTVLDELQSVLSPRFSRSS